jgi:hypothetical protein
VTRLDDPVGGTCSVGNCSLRQAVSAANGSGGADTITLPVGSIVLSQNGLPTISQDTTFIGKGRDVSKITGANTVASGPGVGGVFTLFGGAVTFERLTITGNQLTPGPVINGGAGAVLASAVNLTFIDSAVTQNRMDATAMNGAGGILNVQGVVTGSTTLINTTVAGNTRTGGGPGTSLSAGGVASLAVPLTIVGSTISGNSTGTGNVTTAVGAVLESNAAVTIDNSTISGNSSQGGTVTQRAGGVFSDTGAATLSHVTVADNFTSFDGGLGQNLAAVNAGSRVVRNSILSGAISNCSGTWTSQGGNVEAGVSCGFTPSAGDKPFVDPLLGPLADNGGPTQTRALDAASPAIDAGRAAVCSAYDQRGVARPQIAGCDSGAYELGPPSNTAPPTLGGSPAVGQSLTCDPGTWRGQPTFVFAWLRDGVAVPGSGPTYAVTAADAGHALQCSVSGGNAAGATSAVSGPQAVPPVAPAPPISVPGNSARPAISGASRSGQPLTCTPGTWSGGPTFAFGWLRNGAPIAGATATRYTLAAGDVGKAIQCAVRATNSGGSVIADSAPRIVGQACIVPRLKGASLASARSRLARAHCALGKVTRAYSTSVKSGRVIRSNPGAAANLAAGTKVGLQLSKGRKPRKK